MAIFISYNHEDKDQAQLIATNLVQARKNVWIDKWEINAGDSLIQRIEEALGSADAILILLSETSVNSEWCRKELRSGILRELEEKSTLVIPIRLDDTEVPLFLREKLWIDLRPSARMDEQFSLLLRSLESVTNPVQRRIEQPDFHTDWSMTHIGIGEEQGIEWSFVEHSEKLSFVVLTQVIFFPKGSLQKKFVALSGDDDKFRFSAELMNQALDESGEITVTLDTSYPQVIVREIKMGDGAATIQVTVRRMGNDTGMDTLVHVDNVLRQAVDHTLSALRTS